MTPEELFEQLAGRWTGMCRTWFELGKPRQGEARDRGFSVSGKHAFDASAPEWGWRTQYVL